MQPAFSSTKQAAAFAALMLAILLSPALIGESWLRSRDQIYSSLPWGAGPYPYLHDQIFEEKEDIDVAFMGPSTMWYAIDTPYFQEKLSKKLERPAVVRTICWDWIGADAFYRITKDLLEHRRVRMIVFCDPTINASDTAHTMASDLFRWPERSQDLNGLQPRAKSAFYAAAIIGMPKNLLGRIRPDLPLMGKDAPEISWVGFGRAKNPFLRLGSLSCRIIAGRDFVEFTPSTHPDPAKVFIYSEATKTNFQFLGNAPTHDLAPQPMQITFLKKVAALARKHDVKMTYLYLPRFNERTFTTVEPTLFWPDIFDKDTAMIGIPPAELYAGLSDDDIVKFYWESRHYNENGQKFFTPIITPALVHIYETKIQH